MKVHKVITACLNLFVDMAVWTDHIAMMNVELTTEERNLFSVAHKNLIGARRASWRVLCSLHQKQSALPSASPMELRCLERYIQRVESELTSICQHVLPILETHLLPQSRKAEHKVFYWKMCVPSVRSGR